MKDIKAQAREEAERWNPILGYEGFYEVSDLGNVRNYIDESLFDN